MLGRPTESLFAGLLGQSLPRWRYEFDPFLEGIISRGMQHSAERAYRTYLVRAEMWSKLAPILERCEILICPNSGNSVDPRRTRQWRSELHDQRQAYPGASRLGTTYPFNLLNQLPVASVPSGFAQSTGVPTGLQIVGRPFDDIAVFRASAAYETARPWLGRHPAI